MYDKKDCVRCQLDPDKCGCWNKEPLPCPFCGGEVAPFALCDSHHHYIQCYNDDCEVNPGIRKPSDTEEEVIARWNERKEK